MTDNFIIIGIILSSLAATIYFLFKKDYLQEEDDCENTFSVEYLREGIKERMNLLADTSYVDHNLSKDAARKEEARKLELIKALRTCGYGDLNAKLFILDYIKKLLQKYYGITESTINKVIAFEEDAKLSVIDMFDILLYIYKKKYRMDAFYYMVTENGFHELKGAGTREDEYHYEITKKDITDLYYRTNTTLDYLDKLEIVSQRVYSVYQGNGVIDELRDMKKLDGCSAGLSGLPNNYYNYLEEYLIENREEIEYYYNSIWCMFQGKTIHLSFLGFGSQAEMVRVAKKIYRYDDPGYLSEDKGYIINSMSDGSRVVVVRPKVAENWAFFIRKLNSIEDISMEKLLTDKNSKAAIQVIEWLVKSCSNIAVTGKQFSGKTTLLKSLGEFINPQFNIGVQEMIFELYYKKIPRYYHRNIMTLRDTPSVSGQAVMDLFKKMDRDIFIFGECHSPESCSLVVQGALAGTRQIMWSHHAKTTASLIDSFKVSLQLSGLFPTEIMTAEEQVARAINFDFHMATTSDGHIYLERITEIIPDSGEDYPEKLKDCFRVFFTKMTSERRYKIKDIVVFKNGEYNLVGIPSSFTRERVADYLTLEEMSKYDEFFNRVKEEGA